MNIWIDSNNNIGDAFAITSVLKSDMRVSAISSIFGNVSESIAFKDNQKLAKLCGFSGLLVHGTKTNRSRGSYASETLSKIKGKFKILALGPLTNIALALEKDPKIVEKIDELIWVGTNLSPLPAFKVFNYNQASDLEATRVIFRSSIPLTLIPYDVARKLKVTKFEVARMPHHLTLFFIDKSPRRFKKSFSAHGLVAASYVTDPKLFEVEKISADLGVLGMSRFGVRGGKVVKVIKKFDPDKIWENFFKRLK